MGQGRRREAPAAGRGEVVRRTASGVPRAASLPALLRLLLLSSAGALQIGQQAQQLGCSKGLTDCSVAGVSHYSAALPDLRGQVNVQSVELKVNLCCSEGCKPCLQILITFQDLDNEERVSEESGEHGDEDESSGSREMAEESGRHVLPRPKALVKVCLSSPGSIESCKAIQFRPSSSLRERQIPHEVMWMLLTEKAEFGSPVVVHVHAQSHTIRNITIPSLQEGEITYCNGSRDTLTCTPLVSNELDSFRFISVCALIPEGSSTAKECDAPRIQAVTDGERNVVRLQLEDVESNQGMAMFQMFSNEIPGKIFELARGEGGIDIPSNAVVPCLCFQVWWKGQGLHKEFCPFKYQQDALERMQNNVSVSMEESVARGEGTVLTWNVTAPCRLEGELWLCKKASAGGLCEEVTGSRQRLHNHRQAGWRASRNGHWKKGEFANVSRHPSLCVQIKVHGMDSNLEPQCPFATPRWRWSLPIIVVLLLICLAILGACVIHGFIKGYVWRWVKEDDIKGAIGGRHVVLLYPGDGNQALPDLVCRLGSSLKTLGFTVSLDLWSQAELSVLGPVPWLHSRLDCLQRQGGKVVLVLTQAVWVRAEEWGRQAWERDTPKGMHKEVYEDGTENNCCAPSSYSDAFNASLSCILADYLQGRAGERFVLVQFESLPPQPPSSNHPLPELFRGLHLFSLPSQSLGFLTELAVSRRAASASARRRKAGGLRAASRALAQGLKGFTAGSSVLRFAGLSQDCVGTGAKDSWETVPLQSCLTTPPSSPDTCPRVSEMEWV
ncbi:uncharacterized protein wu:fl23c11 [Lampris incognitus]|uniref:uncharacterized protein wu:fl23c11 n=1 Tax=Lampris incognitus TaxID=2546036 RepID=UPI0024B5B0DA|nr:uncharacterized protein wu:fl23c11 [Lampris incognitus]